MTESPIPTLVRTQSSEAVPGPVTWRGTGHLLIVDDEESVRTVVDRSVTRLGFTPHCAADGPEAITLFEKDPALYSLALLDRKLTSMDGFELMRRLRLIRPDLRVILMSGCGRHELEVQSQLKMATGVLNKPFTLQTLAAEIRAALGV